MGVVGEGDDRAAAPAFADCCCERGAVLGAAAVGVPAGEDRAVVGVASGGGPLPVLPVLLAPLFMGWSPAKGSLGS